MRGCVSHDSHRGLEKGCAKQTVYVKSRSEGAWNKEMRRASPPQGAKD
jgi:hypothetical protein